MMLSVMSGLSVSSRTAKKPGMPSTPGTLRGDQPLESDRAWHAQSLRTEFTLEGEDGLVLKAPDIAGLVGLHVLPPRPFSQSACTMLSR